MNKANHKEVKLKSSITKLMGYSDDNFFSISKSSDKDTFISNVKVNVSGKGLQVNVLYQGNAIDTPIELLEDFLCKGDTSYNPSRPFRWYRGNIVADTNNPESIKDCRTESFNKLLAEIDNPEWIFIYEIIELLPDWEQLKDFKMDSPDLKNEE